MPTDRTRFTAHGPRSRNRPSRSKARKRWACDNRTLACNAGLVLVCFLSSIAEPVQMNSQLNLSKAPHNSYKVSINQSNLQQFLIGNQTRLRNLVQYRKHPVKASKIRIKRASCCLFRSTVPGARWAAVQAVTAPDSHVTATLQRRSAVPRRICSARRACRAPKYPEQIISYFNLILIII